MMTTETTNRTVKRLSVSQINCYLESPLKYFHRYISGRPEPKSSSMVFGIAIHNVLAFWLRQRELGQTESEASLLDLFTTIRAQEQLKAEQMGGYQEVKGDTPEKQANDAQAVLKLALPIAATLKPKMIEECSVLNLDGVPLIAYCDVVESSGCIVDWKTTGRTLTIPPAPSLQEMTYSHIGKQYLPNTDLVPSRLIYLVRPAQKREAEVIERTTIVTEADRCEASRIAREVWDSIQAKWGGIPVASPNEGADLFEEEI